MYNFDRFDSFILRTLQRITLNMRCFECARGRREKPRGDRMLILRRKSDRKTRELQEIHYNSTIG